MEVNRPQTTSQTSRKGKKAWRKNVNIDEIHSGLEESRERQILFGKDQATSSDDAFIIDNEGDAKVAEAQQPKKLKSQEILTNKSKVQPLQIERNNRTVQGVDKRQLHKLMKLSGRVQGESKLKARVDKDGLIRASSKVDPWAEEAPVVTKPNYNKTPSREIFKDSAVRGITKPSHAPKTYTYQPIQLENTENDTKDVFVDAGKSYNPSLESWKSLIDKEFNVENEKELKRLQIQEYKEKISALIQNSTENELMEDSSSEEEDDDDVDAEKQQENPDDAYILSINKPTQVKIKSKAQRNRQARNKQRKELEDKLALLKHQLKDLAKLEDYNKEVESQTKKQKSNKNPKKLFKFNTQMKPIEVKLSDELTDNLRNVKPEGNLFYDQMIKMQNEGKIEARVPVAKKRKYAPKITEKWTYKDFK